MLGSALAVVYFMYMCDSCDRVHDVDTTILWDMHSVFILQKGDHRCCNESAGTTSI